jgi:hypothetical protein
MMLPCLTLLIALQPPTQARPTAPAKPAPTASTATTPAPAMRAAVPLTPYSDFGGILTEEERRMMDEAFQYFYHEHNWPKAAKAYEAIARKNPKIGIAWFRLGYALHAQGKLDEAIAAGQRAAEFPRLRATALYNIACAYALKGKQGLALDYLEKAVREGFDRLDFLEGEGDLISLRDDPRYRQVVEKLRAQNHADAYQQFDFWIGEWDVTDPAGRKLGVSSVRKAENGALVTERWTGMGNYTGTNFFYFDPGERHWCMHWISSTREVIRATGRLQDGALVFQGHHVGSDGRVSDFRGALTRLPGGKVQQKLELGASGANWRVYFEGVYVPSAAKSR